MRKNVLSKLLVCGLTAALLTGFATTAYAAPDTPQTPTDTYPCQLYGEVTDAGQVVKGLTIDFGAGRTIGNVDKDTFTVHANASTEAFLAGTDVTSVGDYDIDRKIISAGVDGQLAVLLFDRSEGATLAYTSGARNYPATLTYTITQNKPVTLMAADGTVISDSYMANYVCNNVVFDEETAKFQSVKIKGGIDYQFYNAGQGVDKLVVWFHGNGEGDLLGSRNNVAQMLANRGTVAWASEEFQNILGGAHVMAFQAPDTWYYAQRDGLLDIAANEINAVIRQYGIDPKKVVVSGCSAGGYMTTRMLIAHPNMFAAAMINCPALDVATARGGQTPTDEELASIKASDTKIWLVQGVTDASVATDQCSRRMFNILTDGMDVSSRLITQHFPQNSRMTTYEAAGDKYKLSLYETTVDGKLLFAEDYDWDGVMEEVTYSNHWSWIYTLRNNPQAADGTHIVNWAAGFIN